MKKLFRAFVLVCALLVSVCAFFGCGRKVTGDEHTIQLYMWKSGFGTDWMEKLVEDFNNMQDEYTVKPEYTSSASTIINTLSLGTANEYDLYFTMLNTVQYNDSFASLNDVVNSNAMGESVSIESKYNPQLLNGMKDASGNISALNYASGWTGILYNTDYISEDEVPNTTKELEKLVPDFGKNAWLFYNDSYNNGYWNYVLSVWEAQYDGVDYFYNTMMKLDDGKGNVPSKDVMLGTDKGVTDSYEARLKDGRYKALEAMQSVVTPTTVHGECTNTNFTTVQSLFLQGESAMYIGGNWLFKEMKTESDKIRMMRIPVISSITETLEDTSMSDATLSAIIDEIDADPNATSSELCSENDFKRIKEARSLMYNNGTELYVFIPEYSNCIDGAKEFLRYFYSDAGMLTYMNSTKLPGVANLTDESKFDTSNLSSWYKQSFDFQKNLTPLVAKMDRSDIFKNFGLNQFANLEIAQSLSAQNPNDRQNADMLWREMIAKVNGNWEDWV